MSGKEEEELYTYWTRPIFHLISHRNILLYLMLIFTDIYIHYTHTHSVHTLFHLIINVICCLTYTCIYLLIVYSNHIYWLLNLYMYAPTQTHVHTHIYPHPHIYIHNLISPSDPAYLLLVTPKNKLFVCRFKSFCLEHCKS